jgi:hypothetical protein
MRFVLFLCGLTLFVPTFFVHAQISNSITGAAVSIALDPQFPNPGEPVTASIDDYSINSTGATISWFFEGHELPAMRNKRSITVPSDKNGADGKISAQLSFSDRPALQAEAIIHPIYLDVIVEPQTYTPIFYAGRALPVYGSTVNLTALMQLGTGMINPQNNTYTWELNGTVLYGGPQRGTNRAQITIPYGLSNTLIVSVQNSNGITIGRRLINIPSVPVELHFYEESALYGLNSRAIGQTLHVINNSTIRAVPYYLSTEALANNTLQDEWSIDGQTEPSDSSNPFSISLQSKGAGSAHIGFKFRNLNQLIQGDEKSFTATF